MNRILMTIMAVAAVIAFSAPSFAGEEKKDQKKGGHVLVYGDENKDNKDEKNGSQMDTFGEKKEDKKDEKRGK